MRRPPNVLTRHIIAAIGRAGKPVTVPEIHAAVVDALGRAVPRHSLENALRRMLRDGLAVRATDAHGVNWWTLAKQEVS